MWKNKKIDSLPTVSIITSEPMRECQMFMTGSVSFLSRGTMHNGYRPLTRRRYTYFLYCRPMR
jgi:hypothetical protein